MDANKNGAPCPCGTVHGKNGCPFRVTDPDTVVRYRPPGVPFAVNVLARFPDRSTRVEAPKPPRCVECGESSVKGEPGARTGPVYSWLDVVTGAQQPRCRPCHNSIMAYRYVTLVKGSPITEWYRTQRLTEEYTAKLAKAKAAKDAKLAAKFAGWLQEWAAIRQRIIREHLAYGTHTDA